jgi:hypothetical protein
VPIVSCPVVLPDKDGLKYEPKSAS